MIAVRRWLQLLMLFAADGGVLLLNRTQRLLSAANGFSSGHLRYSPKLPIDIVIGLPEDEGPVGKNPFQLTLPKSKPVFDVAEEDIYYKYELLQKDALRISYIDTQLSDAVGPQRFVERYCNASVDAVMGLAYVFALAPVARMSAFWYGGVPVFTTTAMVDELGSRVNFPLLTRLMGSYKNIAKLMQVLVRKYRWNHFYFMFNDQAAKGTDQGRSECYFSLSTIKNDVWQDPGKTWNAKIFSEGDTSREKYIEMLKEASYLSNRMLF